jgi:acyl-CoA reductase-like NAD-dependent aldehyde dehydrogenase
MGPLISAQQRGAVLGAVEQAEHEGARLRTGGRAPDDLDPSGFFVAPTVFDEVDPGSALAQEEVFGPVLAVIDVADEAEALAVADGTRYGLAAGVWTSDLARAHRVASALRCGQVFVNTYGAGTGIELPFGGTKHSGFGREKGVEGYLAYTQTKNIAIKVGA